MKKSALLPFAALLLSACCCLPPGTPTSTQPAVYAVNGKAVVAPDPLVFTPAQRNVTITWQLPAGAGYTFDAGTGIAFTTDATGEINCGDTTTANKRGETLGGTPQPPKSGLGRSPDGLSFTCLNLHTKPGVYKYSINLSGPQGAATADPSIFNM